MAAKVILPSVLRHQDGRCLASNQSAGKSPKLRKFQQRALRQNNGFSNVHCILSSGFGLTIAKTNIVTYICRRISQLSLLLLHLSYKHRCGFTSSSLRRLYSLLANFCIAILFHGYINATLSPSETTKQTSILMPKLFGNFHRPRSSWTTTHEDTIPHSVLMDAESACQVQA